MNLFGPPNVKKLAAQKDVKGLIKNLGYQKDHAVQNEAAYALGQIGDARAVEPLIAALKDFDRDGRIAAAVALGQIGDDRAVEPLIAALKDFDKDVRLVAAVALGQIGDARAVEPLIAMLKDPWLDPKSVTGKIISEALLKSGRMTVEQLERIVKPIVAQYRINMEPIITMLQNPTSGLDRKRLASDLETCSSYSEKNLINCLMTGSGSSSNEWEAAICISLGKIGTAEAKEALGNVLSSHQFIRIDGVPCRKSSQVRIPAKLVLKRLGPPAPKSLIEGITDEYWYKLDEYYLRDICDLLVDLADSSTKEALTKALRDTHSDATRRQIQIVLSRI